MFSLQHIYKSFADKMVLNDVSLSLHTGDVIALIGENGVGKTTLLEIIAGKAEPDGGTVALHGETVGYVPQEAPLGLTIGGSFKDLVEPWRSGYALSTVGLDHMNPEIPVRALSGGQKTRLLFATVLAQVPEPTILLLDEPTNNLDTEGLIWLEQFIASFTGAILLVSHDRAFINRTTTGIVELNKGCLRHYGGNYDSYSLQKAVERQTELERYEMNIEERKHLEKVLHEKQERATRGLRSQKSRDKDKAQFDWHQNSAQRSFSGQARAARSRLDQLEEVERPEHAKEYRLSLNGTVPASKRIVQLQGITKQYAREVLRGADLEIRGRERIHISGQNGSGKTTLLKIAAGLVQPDSGKVQLGHAISVGYFSQDSDGLDHTKTALENLASSPVSSTILHRQARGLGLTMEDLKRPVSTLSRGQQAKLGFAKLLLGTHHVLVLDEPTNHLDIPTREHIETALEHYDGAILFASHDQYFVDTLQATKTFNLYRGVLQ